MRKIEGLTVRQLIQKLEQIPDKSVRVLLEGCDCDGYAKEIENLPGSQTIWGWADPITRILRYHGRDDES